MNFIEELNNKSILICSNSDKRKVLNELYDEKKLLDFKIMNLNEFIKKVTFDYDTKTIYYIMNEYHLSFENAKSFINELYYIENKQYNDEKLIFLSNMKNKLMENHLLIIDNIFTNELNNYDIYVYLDNYDKNFLEKLVSNNLHYLSKEYNVFNNKEIIEFENMNDEIEFVAYSINELLSKGISINNIKISGISSEYKFNINQIFNNYNLDLDIYKTSIYSTVIGSYFINNISDNILDTINDIKNKFNFNNELNNEILNKIIDICNKYTWVKNFVDIKECLIYEFKNTYIDNKTYKNKIEIVDIKELENDDENYIFLIGFNQENIPTIYKDDKYLTDKLLIDLGLEDSNMKNKREKEQILKIIKSIKNLTITYKKKSSFNDYFISNLNDDFGYEVVKKELNFNTIRSMKQLNISVCKYLDTFTKYGIKNKYLEKLYFNTNISYRIFNNKYKTINIDDLMEYLNYKLLLSYTGIDKYYHCAFSYYISNILKLDTYEEKFSATLGSLIHDILSKCFNQNFSFENEFNNYINNIGYELSAKEKFFLNNVKEEIIYIINTIKKQKLLTGFDKELYEKKIYIELDNKIKVTFMGIIDKMMILSRDGKDYVSIIDYKTGNPNTNLDHIKDGLTLQLPIYAYLIKNSNLFGDPIISGIYYQKILNGKQKANTIEEYEKEKYDNLKLIGLSTNDEEILSIFDSTYENSELIKSMKLTSKGFSSYAKVFSETEMDDILEIAKTKIDEAVNNILSGNFKINPKELKFENIGCKFCKYKDLCYMTESDKEIIKEGE